LIRRKSQAGFINGLSLNGRLALMKALVLMLVLSNQTWAGNICHCNPQTGAQHASCHEAQQSTSMESEERGGTKTHSWHQRAWKEMPAIADKDKTVAGECSARLPHGHMTCCHANSRLEIAVINVSPPGQMPLINALALTNLGIRTNPTPAPVTIRPMHSTRPIYLADSCLLI
jgi:hypothetical protein